ncbi:hypothetical protein [Amycolatopsis sp. 195334CR]|uniref:hypothetical protein n=1 Tax=Amycolatopsis sp. 195334CR TaxID=2814588 RepID=UPI001A8FFA77|nr:hypothetical protein [Amycolatopsis sp. 195334CR]MBN6041472.1 hypothetical protein [Amycolatopsis sp. 195334CR]
MTADPFGTLGRALWLGGAQWAGKSTVARLLAERHGLTAFHYDYQGLRAHHERDLLRRLRRGLPEIDDEQRWVTTTPEEMAAEVLGGFPDRFEWTLDDLRSLVSPRPILVEGWGLRPELVVPAFGAERMVVLVPTEEFRDRQVRELPRAGSLGVPVSDPERAQRNRLARDRLVAADAVRRAREFGVPVIEVDGTRDAEGIADEVQARFSRFL